MCRSDPASQPLGRDNGGRVMGSLREWARGLTLIVNFES
jgi:hypothetical protein